MCARSFDGFAISHGETFASFLVERFASDKGCSLSVLSWARTFAYSSRETPELPHSFNLPYFAISDSTEDMDMPKEHAKIEKTYELSRASVRPW